MSSFDSVVGYSPVVSAVRLPSWPTPKFFNRLVYLESPSTRRILNESNRNATNAVNGKFDGKKENETMTQEVETSKVDDYPRGSWQPQNKSNHMMQLLFDTRSEADTDAKPIRLTESEYRSMTAQLRAARQVVAHSKSVNNRCLTPTSQLVNSPRTIREKTPRPYLLQPCLMQQSLKGYLNHHLIDGKKLTDDRHHQIVMTSKARLNPSRALDRKQLMTCQTPSTETEVPRDLPANQSSSGDEDDHLVNLPCRPPGKDHDSDSTSSDDDSRYFLHSQTKSSLRTKDASAAAADSDEYRFATPLSEDVMRLDLTGMSRVERDWRTLTNVRPKTQTEARILDRLLQMERFQAQTVELESGMRRPVRISNNSPFQAPGKYASRARAPSRRSYPDFDNTRKSNAPPAGADFVCQLCLERHTVRSCVDNVYASRSRSTIDFDKYDRATPNGPSNRMGPTAQGRASNPPATGAVRGRAKPTNAARAARVNEYSGSTNAPLQALQGIDMNASIGGSSSAQPVDAPSDLVGAFKALGLPNGQAKCSSGEYSSLKPTLTSFEGSRTVTGTTNAKGNLIVPAGNYRKTSIVDVEVRTPKPPRLKSATRSVKGVAKRRPQTAV